MSSAPRSYDRLLITGVTGFLGGHMALEALRRGYHVHGTVRRLSNADRVRNTLRQHLGPAADDALSRLEFHEADLLESRGWSNAAKGCDAVLHVASPFPLGVPRDEQDLIAPARQGLRHVFDAADRAGIRRFVHTSSTVAITYGHGKSRTAFSEDDWTNLDGGMISAYIKSKTLAERDLWTLARQSPEIAISSVNPGFILGPVLDRNDPGTSCDVVLKMMRGAYPGVPRLGYPTVDVRDVVQLHFSVLEDIHASGERFAAASDTLPFKALAQALKDELPKEARKVGTRQLPNFFVRAYALIEKSTRGVLDELGYMPTVSSEKARQRYGWTPRSAKDAALATAQSLIDLEYIR